jgi:hypothetical protein
MKFSPLARHRILRYSAGAGLLIGTGLLTAMPVAASAAVSVHDSARAASPGTPGTVIR